MPLGNYNSSDLTRRIQSRVNYADYIVKQQKFEQGCSQRVELTSGSGADNASSTLLNILVGATFTTPTEQTTLLANNSCFPTTTTTTTSAPSPSSDLKLLILGDSSVSSAATAISNRLVALGYTSATVASAQLGTTYTGSAINTSTYNVVLIWTNSSQTGAAALSTNLKNYVNSGGNLVSATFIWNLYPSGFDFTITPFQSNSQSNDGTGNMTVNVVHPITTGVNTALTGGAVILNNGAISLQSGATKIASYTTSGSPLVAIQTVGSSRLVGLNIGMYILSSYPNLCNLTVNACLWANGNI